MTRYREFIPRELPLRGLAADPRAKEVQPGEWATHDQFHIVNRRIWKYPGWQKWNPEVDYYYYYGSVIGGDLLDRYVLHLPDDSGVIIQLDNGLAPIVPPTPFTLEFWLRLHDPGTGTTQINPVFGMWHFGMRTANNGGQPNGLEWRMNMHPGGGWDGAGVGWPGTPPQIWDWHHVALTFDGTTFQPYVDGVANPPVLSSQTSLNPTPLWPYVGAGDFQFVNSHQGVDMYDFHWSSIVRYSGDFTPSTNAVADGNTVLLWKFDNNLNDSSINLRHGVEYSGPPATSFVLR